MVLDSETAAMMKVASILAPTMLLRQTGLMVMGSSAVPMRPEMEAWFRVRLEMIQAGLDRVPTWFQKKVHRFDPNLRLRWDVPQEHADNLAHRPLKNAYWLIEHYSSFDGCYHACGYWEHALTDQLFEELRKSDMRRKSEDEHISEEHERAEKREKANDAAIADQLCEVIDGMSAKQLETFIAASEAMSTGETVTAHGPDLKFMERLEAKNRQLQEKDPEGFEKAFANEGRALNPGMKPGIYQRKSEG